MLCPNRLVACASIRTRMMDCRPTHDTRGAKTVALGTAWAYSEGTYLRPRASLRVSHFPIGRNEKRLRKIAYALRFRIGTQRIQSHDDCSQYRFENRDCCAHIAHKCGMAATMLYERTEFSKSHPKLSGCHILRDAAHEHLVKLSPLPLMTTMVRIITARLT